MSRPAVPMERLQFEAQQLMANHPPIWRDRNKQIVFGIACPPGTTHKGRLDYSRWMALPLPSNTNTAASAKRVVGCPGFYDYIPVRQICLTRQLSGKYG